MSDTLILTYMFEKCRRECFDRSKQDSTQYFTVRKLQEMHSYELARQIFNCTPTGNIWICQKNWYGVGLLVFSINDLHLLMKKIDTKFWFYSAPLLQFVFKDHWENCSTNNFTRVQWQIWPTPTIFTMRIWQKDYPILPKHYSIAPTKM